MTLLEEIFDTDTTANDGGKQETKQHSAMSRTPLPRIAQICAPHTAVSGFFETVSAARAAISAPQAKTLDEARQTCNLENVPTVFSLFNDRLKYSAAMM